MDQHERDAEHVRLVPKWDELARLIVMAVCGWGLMIGGVWAIVQIV